MHGNQFWWAWHLWFWRFYSFFKHLQNGQNFPSDHGGVKKWNWLKKFMQVEVDVKCMETNFCGHGIFGFGDFTPFSNTFKTAKISLQTMDYSP